jgi:hypothetical protein
MSDFNIDFLSREGYEFLAIEISFRGQILCQLFRRTQDDRIDIEFVEERFVLPVPVEMKFPLDEFLSTLTDARKELMALKLS